MIKVSFVFLLTFIGSYFLFLFLLNIFATDNTNQLKDCQLANNLLIKICLLSNVARNQACRLLVEIALYPPVSPIFGAIIKPDIDCIYPSEVSLLKENIKQVS